MDWRIRYRSPGVRHLDPVRRRGRREVLPELQDLRPIVGKLGERMQPKTKILAALGVVCRGRDQGIRRKARPSRDWRDGTRGPNAETARVATHFIERKERHVPVEQRVLESFRHDGSSQPLEAAPKSADEVRIRACRRRGGEVGKERAGGEIMDRDIRKDGSSVWRLRSSLRSEICPRAPAPRRSGSCGRPESAR